MSNRKSIAVENKKCGKCNCAQAIICAYRDKAKISDDMAMKLGMGFAAGMGNAEGTCGALVGAGVVLGLVNDEKSKCMRDMRNIMEKFNNKNGAVSCRKLKENSVQCDECVADVADLLDETLNEEKE